MRRMKKRLPVVLAVAAAIGFAITAVSFGVGATHIVCSQGPVLGWSGTLASPIAIAPAPPGGYVNSSYSLTTVYNSTYEAGESGWSDLPQNSSSADSEDLNWTLFSERSTTALGWGSEAQCNGDVLVPGTGLGGCGGCVVAPPAPAGIGQRLVVPSQLYNDSSSALINASYSPTPIATITWSGNQSGVQWTNPAALSDRATIGPFYEYGHLFGLGISVRQSSIGFGVPIHLLAGGNEIVTASFPQDWPAGPPGGTTLTIEMTYVLPESSAQGTWAVYLPGGEGSFSPGGLLFEQTG